MDTTALGVTLVIASLLSVVTLVPTAYVCWRVRVQKRTSLPAGFLAVIASGVAAALVLACAKNVLECLFAYFAVGFVGTWLICLAILAMQAAKWMQNTQKQAQERRQRRTQHGRVR